MGKTPKKPRQHSFYERYGKAAEARTVRTMHTPIQVGIAPADRWRPRCYWLDGEVHRIYRVVKAWQDEYHNRWYRVKTDDGTFDLYEHRKWLSLTENRFISYWYLAAEIQMVPVRHATRAEVRLGEPTAGPTPAGRDGRRRTGRGGTPSGRSRTPGSPAQAGRP